MQHYGSFHSAIARLSFAPCLRMLLIGFVVVPFAASAETAPRPPCGGAAPLPAYARSGSAPAIQVWSQNEEAPAWTPPACTGWQVKGTGVLVALAARFSFDGSSDDLLARFGAISALKGLRYWSVTESGWRVLITDAFALKGPDLAQPRADFGFSELRSGKDLYFAQSDNRAGGDVVYRMRLKERSSTRLVMAIENVSPVRKLMLTLFEPGDLRSLHFLEHTSGGAWSYYGLAWARETAASMLAVPQISYVNRAKAFYSHLSGVPEARP